MLSQVPALSISCTQLQRVQKLHLKGLVDKRRSVSKSTARWFGPGLLLAAQFLASITGKVVDPWGLVVGAKSPIENLGTYRQQSAATGDTAFLDHLRVSNCTVRAETALQRRHKVQPVRSLSI